MAQEPLYRRISDELRGDIESGVLAPGDQLPTELELRERFGASRNTIRDAIKRLLGLGLVETRPGQGTFVAQVMEPFTYALHRGGPESDDLSEFDVYVAKEESRGRHLQATPARVEIQRATEGLAAQLGIIEGDPVISSGQVLIIDDIPWAVQTIFYPMEFVNKGALRLIEPAPLEEGALVYLNEELGLTQASWRDLIQCRIADSQEAKSLHIRQDGQALVFEIQRTGFDETGRPMRLAVTALPTDRNRFIYEVGPIQGRKGKLHSIDACRRMSD
jgi:GntR family transcriptional regulator